MKLVRHGTQVVAVIQQRWEKAYLLSQQDKQGWVPLFLVGEAQPFAEIHSETRAVRLCEGRELANEQDVLFHDAYARGFHSSGFFSSEENKYSRRAPFTIVLSRIMMKEEYCTERRTSSKQTEHSRAVEATSRRGYHHSLTMDLVFGLLSSGMPTSDASDLCHVFVIWRKNCQGTAS